MIKVGSKLKVYENDWWEGISVYDECVVVEVKMHSILITNGKVRREIPKTMIFEDFEVVN